MRPKSDDPHGGKLYPWVDFRWRVEVMGHEQSFWDWHTSCKTLKEARAMADNLRAHRPKYACIRTRIVNITTGKVSDEKP